MKNRPVTLEDLDKIVNTLVDLTKSLHVEEKVKEPIVPGAKRAGVFIAGGQVSEEHCAHCDHVYDMKILESGLCPKCGYVNVPCNFCYGYVVERSYVQGDEPTGKCPGSGEHKDCPFSCLTRDIKAREESE